jgi:uncharacterized damage-inducible protein DinB
MLHRVFQHVAWADARVLDALQKSGAAGDSLTLFAHLLAAERVWLTRLRGQDSSPLEIWPDLTVRECETLAGRLRHDYAALLTGLTPGGMLEMVTYRNSSGRAFTASVGDILTHVALHGSYHRGQIAARMRAAGAEPVNTDFITFQREVGAGS